MEYKFQGMAKGGSLKLNDRESFVIFLESMDGKPLTCTFKEVKQVRSLGWNAFYWAVVIPRVRMGMIDVGFEADDLDNEIVHDILKHKFLSREIYSIEKNEILSVTEQTSKIPNDQFKLYIERIQRWSMEFLQMYIPDPNEGEGIGIKQ